MLSICWLWLFLFGSYRGAAAEQVAYIRQYEGYWQVWIQDADKQSSTRLTDSPFDKRLMCYSSATGELIFRDHHGRMYARRIAQDESERPLIGKAGMAKDCDVHPRHGYLVSAYAPNAVDDLQIWLHAANGEKSRLLINSPHLDEQPRWGMRNNSYFYVKTRPGRSAIYRGSLSSSSPTAFLENDSESFFNPAPDPKGSALAYCRSRNDNTDLWVVDLSDNRTRELYAGPGEDTEPDWSADGERIFFTTWDGMNLRIARIDRKGKEFQFISPISVDCRTPVAVSEPANPGIGDPVQEPDEP